MQMNNCGYSLVISAFADCAGPYWWYTKGGRNQSPATYLRHISGSSDFE